VKRQSMHMHKQHGLSLIELMIALVLGLIVVSAVFNTYVGTTKSSSFSEGLQSMQENGRYGIATLKQGLQLAGYSNDGDLDPFDIAASNDASVVVRIERNIDCTGADTAAFGGIAVNTYALDAANEVITCTGNAGAPAMPIIENVEQMRFLWGLDTDGDKVPEKFVPHDTSINNNELVAIRIGILVTSGTPIRTRAGEETHVVLDREFTTNDKTARNVFSSTVILRNGEASRAMIN